MGAPLSKYGQYMDILARGCRAKVGVVCASAGHGAGGAAVCAVRVGCGGGAGAILCMNRLI